jgi:hypothetical protein
MKVWFLRGFGTNSQSVVCREPTLNRAEEEPQAKRAPPLEEIARHDAARGASCDRSRRRMALERLDSHGFAQPALCRARNVQQFGRRNLCYRLRYAAR